MNFRYVSSTIVLLDFYPLIMFIIIGYRPLVIYNTLLTFELYG